MVEGRGGEGAPPPADIAFKYVKPYKRIEASIFIIELKGRSRLAVKESVRARRAL